MSDAPTPPKVGRPTKYKKKLAMEICSIISSSSRGIHHIAKDENMPSASTIFLWLTLHEEFSDAYRRAKELQAELLAEEAMEIADDMERDTLRMKKIKDDSPNAKVKEFYVLEENREFVNRSKLRVDTRKWYASILNPRKYSPKMDLTSGGEKITHPPSTTVIFENPHEKIVPIVSPAADDKTD